MIKQHIPGPGKDVMVMVCGPPGMMAHVSGNKAKSNDGKPPTQGEVSGLLAKMGYTKDMVYKF